MREMATDGSAAGTGPIAKCLRGCLPLAVALVTLAIAPGAARAQFALGLEDVGFELRPSIQTANVGFTGLQAFNGSTIRFQLSWAGASPRGSSAPAGFHASDPNDPRYYWSFTDSELRIVAKRHLNVVLLVLGAPTWAEGPNRPNDTKIGTGAWDPRPAAFAAFMRAAALRYSGRFPDPLHPGAYLPRVRYWEIWNEENLPMFLAAPNLVETYRGLLNGAYSELKAVNADNVVLTGGLAPVSYLLPWSMSPLKFAEQLMCVRRVGSGFVRSRPCRQPARFDIFADHPYTVAATPTKHAYHYDDVLIGDIDKLSRALRTADRLGTLASRGPHPLWVTEWSWFTNPPDKLVGDSEATAARYVAYSMYEMWRSGVQMVVWFTTRDVANQKFFSGISGAGLYTSAGRPKLTLRAFAFPLVASVQRGQALAWGRAPEAQRVRVIIEHAVGHAWQQVATGWSGADGVFSVRFRAGGNGVYRARVANGPVSLAYDSRPIPPKRTHLFYSG